VLLFISSTDAVLNEVKSSGSISTVKGLLMNSVFCRGLTSNHYNFVYDVISLSLSIYMCIYVYIYLFIYLFMYIL